MVAKSATVTLSTFLVFASLSVASGQGVVRPECCGANIMDSNGRVLIETGRPLPAGSYAAVRIRTCIAEPVAVQIWRRTGDELKYRFRWQAVINETNQNYIIVNFNAPMTITADDRIGIFSLPPSTLASPSSSYSSRVPIPFEEWDTPIALRTSISIYRSFAEFDSSPELVLSDITWPRSFRSSVVLCQAAGCTDIAVPTSTVRPASDVGLTTKGQCCPSPILCDSTPIERELTNQTNEIQRLQDQIDRIRRLIESLSRPGAIPGICPPGFTSGTYGTGKCYIFLAESVQLGEAEIRCNEEHAAELIHIESSLQETFLRGFLRSSARLIEARVWTAAMYNIPMRRWSWFDRQKNETIRYSNWLGPPAGEPPVPLTEKDVCSLLVVSQNDTNVSYWINADCSKGNYVICQVDKKCL